MTASWAVVVTAALRRLAPARLRWTRGGGAEAEGAEGRARRAWQRPLLIPVTLVPELIACGVTDLTNPAVNRPFRAIYLVDLAKPPSKMSEVTCLEGLAKKNF